MSEQRTPGTGRPDAGRPERPRIEWLKVAAGALAAVSSAVLLSTLGAAGTIIGAALGSVIASVGSNLYARGLEHSRTQIAEAQELARRRLGVAQAEVRRAQRRHDDTAVFEAHLDHAEEQLREVRSELAAPPPTPSRRERLLMLPWRRIALVAGGFFLVAIVVITGFELIANRPVSDLTGGTHGDKGTSFGNIGGGSGHKPKPRRTPTPTPSSTPTPSVTPTPTPSATPTDLPTEAPSEPITPTPTPTPTEVVPTPGSTETP
jgi:hypothetical protein